MFNKGIAFAGSIIVDYVKMIHDYPECGMLANILSITPAVGGLVPNTAIDIAKLDSTVPLYAIGNIGDDAAGELALGKLKENGINTDSVKILKNTPTGFTDVMTKVSDGGRTFFACNGANAAFCPEDVDIDSLNCDIFHAGYILLLDTMDEDDSKFGTNMARLLASVQSRGIKTSVDVVSESGDRFKRKVIPALKYCNYAIMNEIESCNVAGLDPRNADGTVCIENIKKTCEYLMELGVKDKVIIHSKEAGFCLSSDGKFSYTGSVDVPRSMIKGTVGAGDAFCAGSLYAIYKGYSDEKILDIASCSAVCSLSSADAVSGMKPLSEAMKLGEQYPRMKI